MDFSRLFDVPLYQLKHFPQEKSIGSKVNGAWKFYSTQEFVDAANRLSFGLMKLGIKAGNKVAVAVYKNRPE
ncbi:MAG: hypothetical protein RI943_1018, partial [Bacteroidota bacterium]